MSTRDPFLTAVGVAIDRAAAFLVVALLAFALLWDFVWGRCLGQTGTALAHLHTVSTGTASPIVLVLFGLCAALSLLSAAGISFWLFRLWRRRGELGTDHLRGTRMRD